MMIREEKNIYDFREKEAVGGACASSVDPRVLQITLPNIQRRQHGYLLKKPL